MKEKVVGTLDVEIRVTCPKCDEYIDLFEIDDLNDDGQLWSVIERWKGNDGKGWNNLDIEFECPQCKTELMFDRMEY